MEPSISAQAAKFHFSDSQKDVLRSYFYEQGVNSVGKSNIGIIGNIATEIGCNENQVKVQYVACLT